MKVEFDARPGFYKNGKTTQFVFDILEKNYGLTTYFMEEEWETVCIAVTQALLNSKQKGRKELVLKTVEAAFRDRINNRWFDGRIKGVPTGASLARKRARNKMGGGASRPSFVDTGLYRKSVRVRLIK